jgi:predicted AlkP superfamily pyrophosphatase or phosphodiesterase
MTVVLVTVDGLRPDALRLVDTPHLDRLMARGATSMTARSVMPSKTLPAHFSVFYSRSPARHGVLDNDRPPPAQHVPGLFETVHAHGGSTGMVFGWEPLRFLAPAGCLHLAHFHRLDLTDLPAADHPIVDVAVPLVEHGRFDLLFVYLGATDETGHAHGWMTEEYLRQVEIADGQIGRLTAAMKPDDVILVQSDHGGHDRGHGTDCPEDMTIPWLLSGAGVRSGVELSAPVSLLDTAPTLAALMGFEAPDGWEGRTVAAALDRDDKAAKGFARSRKGRSQPATKA